MHLDKVAFCLLLVSSRDFPTQNSILQVQEDEVGGFGRQFLSGITRIDKEGKLHNIQRYWFPVGHVWSYILGYKFLVF